VRAGVTLQPLEVAEIGSTGVAASIAAFHLGLHHVEMLMAVFFVVAFGGQMVTALLARVSR
jgi:hypothetical protein